MNYGFILVVGMMLSAIIFVSFPQKYINILKRKYFGYGSCIKCGNKRMTWWLLSCDECEEIRLIKSISESQN